MINSNNEDEQDEDLSDFDWGYKKEANTTKKQTRVVIEEKSEEKTKEKDVNFH